MRKPTLIAAAFAASLATVVGANAQSYPSRPITVIVPFPPGGPVDTIGRIIGDRMRASFGQPVIIENQPGASGSIGVGRAARAAPDGYTLDSRQLDEPRRLAGDLSGQLRHREGFRAGRAVAAGADPDRRQEGAAGDDLKEFIAWLKANPDKASRHGRDRQRPSHVSGIFFQNETGTRFQFVPYRGGAPLMQDLVAGQIDLMRIFAGVARCRMCAAATSRPSRSWPRPAGPRRPTSRPSTRPACPGSTSRCGTRCGRPRARPRTSSPSSIRRSSTPWPTRPCAQRLADHGLRDPAARAADAGGAGERSTRPRSRSGGRSSRRRTSRWSDAVRPHASWLTHTPLARRGISPIVRAA